MKTKGIEELFNQSIQLNTEIFTSWLENSLFTWRWWVGFLIIIGSLLLWIKYRKKESQDRLHFAGLIVVVISATLDYIGTFFGYWKYDYEVYPAVSNYLPFSFFALPISVMFLLQIKPKMNVFLKALIYAIFSICVLPLVDWLGIYDPVNWHYFYSFIIQFFVYLIAHFVSRRKHFAELTNTDT